MLSAATICVLLASPAQLQPAMVALFEEREFRRDAATIRYRLFIPEIEDKSKRYPLVIWLHGRGEGGDDNLYQLRWLNDLMFHPIADKRAFPFFVLALQCPHNDLWFHDDRSKDDMIEISIE